MAVNWRLKSIFICVLTEKYQTIKPGEGIHSHIEKCKFMFHRKAYVQYSVTLRCTKAQLRISNILKYGEVNFGTDVLIDAPREFVVIK